jgi:hypothetical protein
VGVAGYRQAEQAGEKDLTRGGVDEVGATYHLAYPLGGVVHDHGELVGGGAVAAADDEVVDLFFAAAEQAVFKRHTHPFCPCSQGRRPSGGLAIGPLGSGELAAGARVAIGAGDAMRG